MTGPDFDVLVIGDANLDLIVTGDVVPRFGQEEQLLDEAVLTLGGSAAITACGLAKLGARTAIVATVGADTTGESVREHLSAAGVSTSWLATSEEAATGLSVLLSGPERAILTYRGALAQRVPLLTSLDSLPSARHLHVGGYFLQPGLFEVVPRLFGDARARGITTSLDTNWDPSGEWVAAQAALVHTSVVLPNSQELLRMGGVTGEGRTVSDRERAARTLGPGLVAVKLGAEGGEVWMPDGSRLSASGWPTEVVDTVGAGDAFNAGFLSEYITGAPAQACLDRAVACGSLSTRALGGIAAQPTADQLTQALAAPR